MRIAFTVPGQPVAKQRPKFARMGTFVRTYTPKETVNYESLVRLAASHSMGDCYPIEGPITLLIEIALTIPASESKKRQAMMVDGRILPTKKPDGDNVLKAIKDACNGVVWRDDSQVVDGRYVKRYSLTPGVRVTVETFLPDFEVVAPILIPQPLQLEQPAELAAKPF